MGGITYHLGAATLSDLAREIEKTLADYRKKEMSLSSNITIIDRGHLEILVGTKGSPKITVNWKRELDVRSNQWFATFRVHS